MLRQRRATIFTWKKYFVKSLGKATWALASRCRRRRRCRSCLPAHSSRSACACSSPPASMWEPPSTTDAPRSSRPCCCWISNASRSCPKPAAHSTASWRRSRRLPATPRTQPPPLSSKSAWRPAATWSMAPSRGAKLGVWRPRPMLAPGCPNVALCERLLADAGFLPIFLDWPRPAFDRSKPRTWLAVSTQAPRRLVDRPPLHRALDHGRHFDPVLRVIPWPVPCVEQRVDAH